MGCGCGGLPASITVRIEAARIAVAAGVGSDPATFKRMATEAHSFLIAGLGDAGEKALDEEHQHGETVGQRNALLNGPLAALRMLREATIDKIEQTGITQVGALVQWTFDQVIEHAGLTNAEAEILNAELFGRGLHFGMDANELRTWIKQGKQDGKGNATGSR